MPVTKELIANIYNPGKFNPQELIDRFVVRLEFFQRFYKELKDSKMDKPEQQYLILARRGMGKTTLLLRIAYEMERDPDINSWMLPVVFNEEEHGVDQLELFWERVAFYLEEKHPEEFCGLQEEMADLYPKLGEQPALFEEEAFNCLLRRLRKHEKKIVLLIDNFGDIYRHFGQWEIQRLRTILQTIPDLRIVGASSIVLNELYDTRHPFYGTFLIRKLEGLSQEETEVLLLSLADKLKDEGVKKIVKEQPQRVEAMRRLTGGVIRTMILLYEVFAEAQEGKALKDLSIIVDRTTPLYQDKMKELSTQQQKIVDAIAQAWDGVTAKEISLATRLSTKTISSQLQGLTENGTIERRRYPKLKSHIYLIEERFFNIWYLMRYGRSDHRVLWLTRFLEEWCADEQTIEARAKKHIRVLKAGTYDPESAYYFSEAMASARYISPDTQHELLESTKEYLNSKGSSYSEELRESDLSVGKKAYKMIEEGKAEHALKITETMRRPDYNLLGVINAELGNISEAEEQDITDFLLLCLAKKQYDFVYDYFTGERGKALKVKDRLKPVWYTLMYFLQEEHPTEYLRMGAELEETVEEMVRLVEEYEEKYK